MRHLLPLLAVSLLIAQAPAATALLGSTTAGEVLVGLEPGSEDDALLAVKLAGGAIQRVEKDLGIAHVTTTDLSTLTSALEVEPTIRWIDGNGRVGSAGAQWNGAQWNTLDWDGAQWNGAQWNGENDTALGANDPGIAGQWSLIAANVPGAWQQTTGTRGATLCVLDSGVDLDHPDIEPNLAGPQFNAVSPGKSADDDGGHGTHVAGIAAGAVGNAWGIAGVGNVRILPAKVLASDGSGTEADLAWGIAWCARQGADVGLMALGASDPGPALDRAIKYATQSGMVLVASAGNRGCSDCVEYPARHPDVVAVGAIDATGLVSSFSSRGSEVDLVAPGVDVLSTFPDGRFAYGSGTSQAAAHAAGVAALMRDANPSISAGAVRDALSDEAKPVIGDSDALGEGLLDAGAAVGAATS